MNYTKVFMSKNDWIDVKESADVIANKIYNSKDGDIITMTLLETDETIYVLRSHITYFLADYLDEPF